MSNKSDGNKFESIVSKTLYGNGFWVHRLAPNSFGQPADIIAVKDKDPYLIDAKNCANDKFTLSRIEENQEYAMHMWYSRGNGCGWFALGLSDGIYMFPLDTLLKIRNAQSSLNANEIRTIGIPIEEWMRRYG